jgi:pyruvate/2-oxoglutarate dehydrogenase complex dihydrolipoamide dehydrogenase (E3) component
MSRRFDAIVIGTGQTGPPPTARLAASGMQQAIVLSWAAPGVQTGDSPGIPAIR